MEFVKIVAFFCLVNGILAIHPRETLSRHIVFHNGKSIDTTEHPTLAQTKHSELKQRFGEQAAQQYLIHFGRPLLPNEKQNIESRLGVKLGVYMPHHTYLVYASPDVAEKAATIDEVKWIGVHASEHKIAPDFFSHFTSKINVLLPPLPKGESARSKGDSQIIANQWMSQLQDQNINVQSISAVSKDKIQIEIRGNRQEAAKLVNWLSERPQAHWIEPVPQYNPHMQYVAPTIQTNNAGGNPTPFNTVNINGTGQVVALADTGLATVSCYFNDGNAIPINAYNGNAYKVVCYNTTLGDQTDTSGHGTLMAGIIAGQNTNGPDVNNGVASGAKLYVYDLAVTSGAITPPADITSMFGPAQAAGASSIVLAFGAATSWYSTDAAAIDDYMDDNADFLVIVSAGNNGPRGGLSSLALSKNALAVGSSVSTWDGAGQDLPAQDYAEIFNNPGLFGTFALSRTSSCGPTPDGRIKPDIVAPGQRVKAASNAACGTVSNNGTSLAAAVVGGATAIIRDYFSQLFYPFGTRGGGIAVSMTSSLVKALLINSGQSLTLGDATGNGNYIDLQSHYPSGYQGFGRIQLDQTLYLDTFATNLLLVFGETPAVSVSTGTTMKFCFSISGPTPLVKATLVWNDPAGSPASGHILVNDLDLAIMDSSGRLWKTITAGGDYDAFNNVEQVEIENPTNGVYAVVVFGRNVPVGTTQPFSLVISGVDPLAADCDLFPTSTCPQSCSEVGSCRTGGQTAGTCDCGTSGKEGLDCSLTPCPKVNGIPCAGNGYCDYLTSTCVCALNFGGNDCTGQRPPVDNGTTAAVVIQYYSGDGGFSSGILAGVAVAAFIIGAIIALILGAFIAVKILERQRDKAMKDKLEMND